MKKQVKKLAKLVVEKKERKEPNILLVVQSQVIAVPAVKEVSGARNLRRKKLYKNKNICYILRWR
jgi:hypothetical protein